MKYVPNIVSALRIIFSLALLFVKPFGAVFFAIYIICGFSDLLDGYIARKTKNISMNGAALDSIGDAVFCTVMLFVFVSNIIVPAAIITWIMAVAFIRTVSLTVGYVKYRKFAFLHTYLNKFTGLILFFIPLLYNFVDINILFIVPCAVASISAVEELIINIMSKKLNRDVKGIIDTYEWAK